MNVLSISVDRDLLPASGDSDALQRVVRYADIVDEYHNVVYHPTKAVIAPSAKLRIYGTGSRSKAAFLADAYRLGARICREHRPDLIFTQDLYATALVGHLLKRRFGIPVAACIHGDMIGNPAWYRESLTHRAYHALGRRLLPRTDGFRVVSTSERAKLERLGVPPERIAMLPVPIPFGAYQDVDGSSLRAELTAGGVSRIVLWVGRMVAQKDLHTLLRAMRQVADARPDTLLVLVGRGPLREEVGAKVTREGLHRHVGFAGFVDAADLPRYYAASDVFVLSSRYEGNARAAFEAAGAGLPCVLTDTSGSRDTVIDGKTGLIVPVGDAAALAHALLEVLSDPERARSMGKAGRAHVLEAYDEARILRGLRDFWDQTAARGVVA